MRDNRDREHKETVLGAGTSFKGRMVFHSALVIKGRFDGEIEADGDIVVEENAVVRAKIEAASIEILGLVQGDADVTGKVEIGVTGSLVGDIKASSLRIEQGAFYKGRISMLKNPESIDIFSASPEQIKKLAMEKG
jgi:cytoskeletal protein CcmA (bactofilin family)